MNKKKEIIQEIENLQYLSIAFHNFLILCKPIFNKFNQIYAN